MAWLLACTRNAVPDFYGVALGMSPRDVRERFVAGDGTWTSEAAQDDYAIKWVPTSASPMANDATFEFHMGSLVAIRADVPNQSPFGRGDPLIFSKATVIKRTPAGDHIHVDVLARSCPTHAAEAKRLVGE